MKRKRVLLVLPLMLVTLMSTMSWAQRFEISPFVGYRTSGSFRVESLEHSKFVIEDGFNFGLALGIMTSPNTEIEFMWSQTNSRLSGSLIMSTPESEHFFDLHTSQFHVNFLYLFPQVDRRVVPYVLLGFGLTYADPKGETNGETRYSWSLGGGIKVMVNERVGLRLQAKWNPTYINTHSELWYSWGYAFFVPVSQYMSQGEFTGGIFFRF